MKKILLASFVFIAACAGSSAQTKPTAQKPLYDRLGGKAAITTVVDVFVSKVGGDARINARFSNTDMPKFKALLVDQICEASGGPCKYTGKDMKTSHAGMKITSEEFDALVEDLGAALTQCKVPAAEQKDLVGVLGPMKPDIVNQ